MVATATYYITIVTEKTGVISVTMAVFQQISLFSAIVTEKQADFCGSYRPEKIFLEETCSVVFYISVVHHGRNHHLGCVLGHLGVACPGVVFCEE